MKTRAEKVRSRGAKLLRKRREEEYQLAEAERKIRVAKAKTELADAQARKKRAEAELWRARKEKLGAIVRLPFPSGVTRKKVARKTRTTAKSLRKVGKKIQKWARKGR